MGGLGCGPTRSHHMISDPNRTVALSSLGLVEHDAIWQLDIATNVVKTIKCNSGARYCSLHSTGASKLFAVAHHFDGQRFEVTVREFADPASVHARAVVDERGRGTIVGDLATWQSVPHLYVECMAHEPWKDFVLIKLSPSTEVEICSLDWYDDSYDKDYQGVTGVVALGHHAIFSVQRSSTLIVQDLRNPRDVRSITLGDRHGNPKPELRDSGKQIWAIDYDTLVVVQADDGRVLRSVRLQGASSDVNEFVGDFSFSPDDKLCLVARPFSGDVVGVDPTTLKTKCSARLRQQPLEVLALQGREVVARDWKSGDLLRGTMKRHWL